MVVLALLGSATAVARRRHIAITILVDRLPRPLKRFAEVIAETATLVMFLLLVWLGGELAWDVYRFEETSPGMGWPQWIYNDLAANSGRLDRGAGRRHDHKEPAVMTGTGRTRPAGHLLHPDDGRDADRGGAGAGRHRRDLDLRSRHHVGADRRLYRHRQIPAAGDPGVHPGRRDLRAGGGGRPPRPSGERPGRDVARQSGRGRDPGRHGDGRHLRLRPGGCGGGRHGDAAGHDAGRLSAGLLGLASSRRREPPRS